MVELQGVSKVFGDYVALREVNLAVNEGEFMTFLGPSGCGKTTCLRLISGFDQPTKGRVFIDGKDVTYDPPYRRNANQVFQSYALFPHLNIFDNVAFGLKVKKIPAAEIKKKVDHVLEMISLQPFAERKPGQLSGGQRQRVALARAIVCEPKVLLLDEPLSALDAKLRQQMRLELKSLQKRLGITFIFVTHDQEEALTMSDRIAVIHQGAVEQLGTASQVYYEPKTRFVATFIGETNLFEATIEERAGGRLKARLEGGLVLESRDEPEIAGPSVLLSLRPEKIRLHRVPPEGSNVFRAHICEEIFRGAADDLTVVTDTGLKLSVVSANDANVAYDFHAGDGVYVQISPSDIRLLPS